MQATPSSSLDATDRRWLLEIAASSIESGLTGTNSGSAPNLRFLPASLTRQAACFVSLHSGSNLRGCCGTLDAYRPLAVDAWRNARASAFSDPRFPPLSESEWGLVTLLEVSVLSELERVVVGSEAELQDRLVHGIDGVVLGMGDQRVTFLPKVWSQTADARQFLEQLKQKAGWPARFWSADLAVWRYGTTEYSLEAPHLRS
jgi:AmmeMemoRadiSam system protein A